MNEIRYERRMTASYMILQENQPDLFDEKVLRRRQIPGLLPMEFSSIDGQVEYWYQITGRKSLETYCNLHTVGLDFMEKLVVRLADQIEVCNRNLLCCDYLMLAPELIFVENDTNEVRFAFCPGLKQDLGETFRGLMEYLLSKLDHTDADAVVVAYELYEKTLEEGYSILDLRKSIAQAHMLRGRRENEKSEASKELCDREDVQRSKTFHARKSEKCDDESCEAVVETRKEIKGNKEKSKLHMQADAIGLGDFWDICYENMKDDMEPFVKFYRKIQGLMEWTKASDRKRHRVFSKKSVRRKEKAEMVECNIYEEPIAFSREEETHKTVCLSDFRIHPDGLLLYEGYEDYRDFQVGKQSCVLGKSTDADMRIDRNTISKLHAQICYEEGDYYIEDLNSTNGTMVNGELLSYGERRKLVSNDILMLADVKYRFV